MKPSLKLILSLTVRFEPTMDGDTVYRHVQLSDGGRKATMRAENLNLPEHPERFTFWRQVLCKEALAGSPYYWEVEWTGKKVDASVGKWGGGFVKYFYFIYLVSVNIFSKSHVIMKVKTRKKNKKETKVSNMNQAVTSNK